MKIDVDFSSALQSLALGLLVLDSPFFEHAASWCCVVRSISCLLRHGFLPTEEPTEIAEWCWLVCWNLNWDLGSWVNDQVFMFFYFFHYLKGLLCSWDGKESACDAGDLGLILGSGRSLGEGNGNPLQYSCLEEPSRLNKVHGVAKSLTKWLTCTTHSWIDDQVFIFSLLKNFFLNWRTIALKNCVGFCQTLTWTSHRYTYVPFHLPCSPVLLHLPLPWAWSGTTSCEDTEDPGCILHHIPITVHSSLPSPLMPQLERMLKIVPSCSQSLLTHPLMLRRPRHVFRFQVIPFYLLLGCGLPARESINSDGETAIEGSLKEIRGLLPIRICLGIIQTWLLMIKSEYKILGTW